MTPRTRTAGLVLGTDSRQDDARQVSGICFRCGHPRGYHNGPCRVFDVLDAANGGPGFCPCQKFREARS